MCKGTHAATHGLASTSRMRTTILPENWQPWTAAFTGVHQYAVIIESEIHAWSRFSLEFSYLADCNIPEESKGLGLLVVQGY